MHDKEKILNCQIVQFTCCILDCKQFQLKEKKLNRLGHKQEFEFSEKMNGREPYYMRAVEYEIEEIDNISIGSHSVGSDESDFEIIDVRSGLLSIFIIFIDLIKQNQ